MNRLTRLTLTLLAAGVAFFPGCFVGLIAVESYSRSLPHRQCYVPLPHHVPSSPNGLSFRFAMAHDVIHERYPKHGPVFYRERERLAREKLKHISADSDEALGLYDDIG